MAKLECMLRTTLADGTVIEKTVSTECDLTHPDNIDRKTMKGLLNDVDKYEKALISIRKEAEKEFAEAVFASDEVKKKAKKEPSTQK
jgi:hypothetical protein